MITIFIDESGTLPDLNDKFVVLCGVVVKQIKEAQNIFSRISGSLKFSRMNLKEIKFYYAGQKSKRQFLSGIVSADFEIFILVVDKKRRKIADSPENYALLAADLINEVGLWYKKEEIKIIIDKHFCRKIDQERFQKKFKKKVDKRLRYQMSQVNSNQNPLVNIADMVAGATLWKYNGKNSEFYDLIKNNIIIEKIISWPNMKRKDLN